MSASTKGCHRQWTLNRYSLWKWTMPPCWPSAHSSRKADLLFLRYPVPGWSPFGASRPLASPQAAFPGHSFEFRFSAFASLCSRLFSRVIRFIVAQVGFAVFNIANYRLSKRWTLTARRANYWMNFLLLIENMIGYSTLFVSICCLIFVFNKIMCFL